MPRFEKIEMFFIDEIDVLLYGTDI